MTNNLFENVEKTIARIKNDTDTRYDDVPDDDGVKVGDILACIWGSTMTLVDFYRVEKITAKTLLIVKLESKETDEGFLTGRSVPTDVEYIRPHGEGREVLRVYAGGGFAKGTYFSKKHGFCQTFEKWNGKPVYYNHCD